MSGRRLRKIVPLVVVACGLVAAAIVAGRARPREQHETRIIDPDNPCGPVAVALVSHLLGKPLSLDEVRAAIDTDPQRRASVAQLVACLRSNGFAAAGVEMEPAALSKLAPATVAILFVEGNHFIVAAPRGGEEVTIFDPPLRPSTRTPGDLPYEWRGQCILAARDAAALDRSLADLGLAGTGRRGPSVVGIRGDARRP